MSVNTQEILIAVGSNIEPRTWIPRGLSLLAERVDILAESFAYRSAAVGGRDPQPDFTNLAVLVRTTLDAPALRATCREVEALCARVRTDDKYAARTLDLDVVDPADPALRAEPFVLLPCADLLPEVFGPLAAGLDAAARATVTRLPKGTYA